MSKASYKSLSKVIVHHGTLSEALSADSYNPTFATIIGQLLSPEAAKSYNFKESLSLFNLRRFEDNSPLSEAAAPILSAIEGKDDLRDLIGVVPETVEQAYKKVLDLWTEHAKGVLSEVMDKTIEGSEAYLATVKTLKLRGGLKKQLTLSEILRYGETDLVAALSDVMWSFHPGALRRTMTLLGINPDEAETRFLPAFLKKHGRSSIDEVTYAASRLSSALRDSRRYRDDSSLKEAEAAYEKVTKEYGFEASTLGYRSLDGKDSLSLAAANLLMVKGVLVSILEKDPDYPLELLRSETEGKEEYVNLVRGLPAGYPEKRTDALNDNEFIRTDRHVHAGVTAISAKATYPDGRKPVDDDPYSGWVVFEDLSFLGSPFITKRVEKFLNAEISRCSKIEDFAPALEASKKIRHLVNSSRGRGEIDTRYGTLLRSAISDLDGYYLLGRILDAKKEDRGFFADKISLKDDAYDDLADREYAISAEDMECRDENEAIALLVELKRHKAPAEIYQEVEEAVKMVPLLKTREAESITTQLKETMPKAFLAASKDLTETEQKVTAKSLAEAMARHISDDRLGQYLSWKNVARIHRTFLAAEAKKKPAKAEEKLSGIAGRIKNTETIYSYLFGRQRPKKGGKEIDLTPEERSDLLKKLMEDGLEAFLRTAARSEAFSAEGPLAGLFFKELSLKYGPAIMEILHSSDYRFEGRMSSLRGPLLSRLTSALVEAGAPAAAAIGKCLPENVFLQSGDAMAIITRMEKKEIIENLDIIAQKVGHHITGEIGLHLALKLGGDLPKKSDIAKTFVESWLTAAMENDFSREKIEAAFHPFAAKVPFVREVFTAAEATEEGRPELLSRGMPSGSSFGLAMFLLERAARRGDRKGVLGLMKIAAEGSRHGYEDNVSNPEIMPKSVALGIKLVMGGVVDLFHTQRTDVKDALYNSMEKMTEAEANYLVYATAARLLPPPGETGDYVNVLKKASAPMSEWVEKAALAYGEGSSGHLEMADLVAQSGDGDAAKEAAASGLSGALGRAQAIYDKYAQKVKERGSFGWGSSEKLYLPQDLHRYLPEIAKNVRWSFLSEGLIESLDPEVVAYYPPDFLASSHFRTIFFKRLKKMTRGHAKNDLLPIFAAYCKDEETAAVLLSELHMTPPQFRIFVQAATPAILMANFSTLKMVYGDDKESLSAMLAKIAPHTDSAMAERLSPEDLMAAKKSPMGIAKAFVEGSEIDPSDVKTLVGDADALAEALSGLLVEGAVATVQNLVKMAQKIHDDEHYIGSAAVTAARHGVRDVEVLKKFIRLAKKPASALSGQAEPLVQAITGKEIDLGDLSSLALAVETAKALFGAKEGRPFYEGYEALIETLAARKVLSVVSRFSSAEEAVSDYGVAREVKKRLLAEGVNLAEIIPDAVQAELEALTAVVGEKNAAKGLSEAQEYLGFDPRSPASILATVEKLQAERKEV